MCAPFLSAVRGGARVMPPGRQPYCAAKPFRRCGGSFSGASGSRMRRNLKFQLASTADISRLSPSGSSDANAPYRKCGRARKQFF